MTTFRGPQYRAPSQAEVEAAGLYYQNGHQEQRIAVAIRGPHTAVCRFIAQYAKWQYNLVERN